MGGVNTLEKITHQYHMHEIYKAAAPIYNKIKENPPHDGKLCGCVNDITGNGILTQMTNIANQLKYFGSPKKAASACFISFRYRIYLRYRLYFCRSEKSTRNNLNNTENQIAELEEAYLKNPTRENAKRLLNVRPWKVNTLVGPDQWVSYQAILTYSMLEQEELNDFATFMYCKLNQPDNDVFAL